jgi:cytochrome oxidase Cu insertion factor (SCO1/SenC/PrrC family)/copper(I)-binding protein
MARHSFSMQIRQLLRPCVTATILALSAAAAACGDGTRRGASAAFRGVAVATPIPKPSFTLTDVNGRPYDFARETRDKVALLFFGYTHCPDVCPLHMANIAAVLRQMSFEERGRIVTVFVTTDPERDTPQRLRAWLANFDASFVGLTGTGEALAAAQASLGLREATREYLGADSANYYVGHAAQVFAFARDGNAYLIYPFGIRQEDWAADLPRLANLSGDAIRRAIAAAVRANAQAVAPEARPPDVTMGGLMVTQALVAEPASLSEAALYLTIRNETPGEDTLVAVATDFAARAEIHATMGTGEMRHMMATSAVPLPARMETRFVPGGTHVMLMDLRRPLRAGDSVTVLLSLARAGGLQARALVVPYAELEKALAGRAGSGK